MVKKVKLHPHLMYRASSNWFEYAKFTLVILFIIGVSLLLRNNYGLTDTKDLLRWLMGTSFMIFGIFKCVGYKYFVTMFPGYDLIAKKYKQYALAYPFIELFLAVVYWFNFFGVYKDIFVIVLTLVGSYGIVKQLRSEKVVHCACLGNIIKLPLSKVSLFENLTMAAMAVATLFV